MEVDEEKIDEAVLALLYLTLHDGSPTLISVVYCGRYKNKDTSMDQHSIKRVREAWYAAYYSGNFQDGRNWQVVGLSFGPVADIN